MGHLPSCLSGGGGPCAGYSGFSLEPRSDRFVELKTPQYAMGARRSCQPFGRSDRSVAALGAAAICDAVRIGFLSWLAEIVVSGRCV